VSAGVGILERSHLSGVPLTPVNNGGLCCVSVTSLAALVNVYCVRKDYALSEVT